jgi:hydroxymethylglutaryl-CoA synthase
MTCIGIEHISFATGSYSLNLEEFAKERGIDPQKYSLGLGQNVMSVAALDEDIVTLASRAAAPLVALFPKEVIKTLLFATESGIDQSKSAGIYVHSLLNMDPSCRVVELKQACYSATIALQLAASYVQVHPYEKVLVIASDIARYESCSNAEPTQGCGAIAMIIGSQANIMKIDHECGIYTEDVMDFWRPNYKLTALVDGKFSAKVYLQALKACWKDLTSRFNVSFKDFGRFCYHLPFTRMAVKAHQQLIQDMIPPNEVDQELHKLESSFYYSRLVGNCYSASIYLGLISMLEQSIDDLSLQKVALFSYGSGCVSEILTGTIQAGYQKFLYRQQHQKLLSDRERIDLTTFRQWQNYIYPTDGSNIQFSKLTHGSYRLKGICDHKRIYELC